MTTPCPVQRIALPLLAGLLHCASAMAVVHERVLEVPVSATNAQGKQLKGKIAVTVFSDPANPVPAPVLVLNHGRSPQAEGRKELHRARFAKQARYFVARGFIVAVPTRLGYGPTLEDDAEDSGSCKNKKYAPALNAAGAQINQVLKAVRKARTDASPDHGVIVGQSFGGAAAVAAAAQKPEGVQAVINFAGGAGGNPRTHAGQPCDPEQLANVFRDFASKAQVPMLWVYAQNDQYFGAQWPAKWHAAFEQGGGHAQFKQVAPFGKDGHELFRSGLKTWEPLVSEFLDSLRLAPATAAPMLAPASAASAEVSAEMQQ